MGAQHTPWWEYTACRDVNPIEFEARDGEHAGRPPERSLRANVDYCQRCPVRIECGKDADRQKAEGLRGGLWRYWDKARANYRVKPVKPPSRRPAVAPTPVEPGPVRYPCPSATRAPCAPARWAPRGERWPSTSTKGTRAPDPDTS